MIPIPMTAFDIAQRFIGVKEIPGRESNDQVLAMLRLDDSWPADDDVAWCSAFANYVAWLLRLPRSKSLRARSWLRVGHPVQLEHAAIGFDIVVLKSAGSGQPGPDVIEASGHVGFFAGLEGSRLLILGGNQGNSVNVSSYAKSRLLGVRRLKVQ